LVTGNTINTLDQLDLLLQKYWCILEDCLRKGNQQNDPEAVMMLRGIHYGTRTLNAIRILLLSDSENAFCAASLARGIFEASIRLLWATRTLNGSQNHWERLQKYWALEEKKWANQAIHFPETRQHAVQIKTARSDILNNDIKKAPSIDQMLKEIDKADQEEQLKGNDSIAEFTYANCYRMLCRASHAHLAALHRKAINDFIGQTCIACLLATNWYCQAICHIAASDTKAEVENIVKQILHIAGRKYDKKRNSKLIGIPKMCTMLHTH